MKYSLRSLIVPKRSWFRFSVRTLFVATTMFAILLGRVVYLRQNAEFHDTSSRRLISEVVERQWRFPHEVTDESVEAEVDRLLLLAGEHKLRIDDKKGFSGPIVAFDNGYAVIHPQVADEMRQAIHHRQLANAYADAAYRPWTLVYGPPEEQSP